MPWKVFKFGNGYKVCKTDRTGCRSKKPLSKEKASAQQKALYANESHKESAFDVIDNIVSEKKTESNKESFEQFLSKRASGAEKIHKSAEAKGGYSILTAIHFAAKAKPYAESEKWADKEDKEQHYKAKAKEIYDKLRNLDQLDQKQFQTLMGELEVWGEVYLRAKSGPTKLVN